MTLHTSTSNTNSLPSLPEIYQQITSLPQDSLTELVIFLSYLRFKAEMNIAQQVSTNPIRTIQLRGIIKNQNFSPELLAQARQEMWHKFQDQTQ